MVAAGKEHRRGLDHTGTLETRARRARAERYVLFTSVWAETSVTLACTGTLLSAWADAKSGRIPNWVTLPLLPLGCALSALQRGWLGAAESMFGALACFTMPWLLFFSSRGRGMGAGDVKLCAALGALLGASNGLRVQLASLLLLAAFALIGLTWRGQLGALLRRCCRLMINRILPRARRSPLTPEQLLTARMGPAVCVATWSLAVLEHLPLVRGP